VSDEPSIEGCEFVPDADSMKHMIVTVIDKLCGQQRRQMVSRSDYYLLIEPVLAKLEKVKGQ
jgi:hypothetical protein